jgi:transcriptional regulator with XRE-family HTH domain
VYRLLQQDGVTQREIARRTGQSQPEVSEIVRGRQVRNVTPLQRCEPAARRTRPYPAQAASHAVHPTLYGGG